MTRFTRGGEQDRSRAYMVLVLTSNYLRWLPHELLNASVQHTANLIVLMRHGASVLYRFHPSDNRLWK